MADHQFTRYVCGVCREEAESMSFCRKGRASKDCGFMTSRWTTTSIQKRWEDMSYEERHKISPGYDD